jgi:hypothetical protein
MGAQVAQVFFSSISSVPSTYFSYGMISQISTPYRLLRRLPDVNDYELFDDAFSSVSVAPNGGRLMKED